MGPFRPLVPTEHCTNSTTCQFKSPLKQQTCKNLRKSLQYCLALSSPAGLLSAQHTVYSGQKIPVFMLFFTFMSRPSWRSTLGFLLLPCVPCSSPIPLVCMPSVFFSLPILYPTAHSFISGFCHHSLSLSIFPFSLCSRLSSAGLTFPSIHPPVTPLCLTSSLHFSL